MAKLSRATAHSQSLPLNDAVRSEPPANTLNIDQAFQRLLPRFNKPAGARDRLEEAFRIEEVTLWGRHNEAAWFLVKSEFFQQHLRITVQEGPEGCHAALAMHAGKIGLAEFNRYKWAVSAEQIETLFKRPIGKKSAAGSKGRDDWEAIMIEAAAFLWEHGTATPDADLWGHLESSLRDPPSRTQLKAHIRQLLTRLREVDRR
jgi:hypothetical protein